MYDFTNWSVEDIHIAMNYALGYVEDRIADNIDIEFIEDCRNELVNRMLNDPSLNHFFRDF